MNTLDQDHVKAPNFVDGLATYNPAGLIQIGGAGFRWNGPTLFASTSSTDVEGPFDIQSATGRLYVKTSGQIVVQSSGEIVIETGGAMTWEDGALITAEDGSTFNLEDGSVLNLAGIMNFGATSEIHGDPRLMSGAELTVASGADVTVASGGDVTVASGGTVTAASGSIVNLAGTTTLTSGTNLNLSPARSWVRHSLRISNVAYVDPVGSPAPNYDGPENVTAWVSNERGAADAFASMFIRTLRTNTDTHTHRHYHWIALDDLPNGGTFSEVVVLAGGVGATPTTTAQFRIIRISSIGTVETMSALTDKNGSWGIETQTTVAVTSNSTISSDYTYALVVLHPVLTGSGTGPYLEIADAEASGTMSSVPIG
jgi:hypothetical protein